MGLIRTAAEILADIGDTEITDKHRGPKKKSDASARELGRRNAPKCGTRGGYEAHVRYNEPKCDACKEAKRVDGMAYRDRIRNKAKQKRKKVAECGTTSGYKRHKRLGEETCDPCLAAKSLESRAYNAGRRQKDEQRSCR